MKPNKTYSPPENSKIRARKQSYNSILNSSEGNHTFLQAGFTLVELLVVIAILGVLAAAILTAIDPARQIARARDTSRKISIKQIRTALESYRTTIGNYPVHGFWLYSTDPEWQTFLSIELIRALGDPTQSGCAAGYPWADGYRCWAFAYDSDGTTSDLVPH